MPIKITIEPSIKQDLDAFKKKQATLNFIINSETEAEIHLPKNWNTEGLMSTISQVLKAFTFSKKEKVKTIHISSFKLKIVN
jgi:hypothetical protein